jgi:hypothetical protein
MAPSGAAAAASVPVDMSVNGQLARWTPPLKMQRIAKDGNCCFAAFGCVMGMNGWSHLQLRRDVVRIL